jgi:hypothetical protein
MCDGRRSDGEFLGNFGVSCHFGRRNCCFSWSDENRICYCDRGGRYCDLIRGCGNGIGGRGEIGNHAGYSAPVSNNSTNNTWNRERKTY